MNRGITAAYADEGLWRGPNTLKYRSATPSISPPRAYASTYCSLASLDAAYGERGNGSTVSTFGRSGVPPKRGAGPDSPPPPPPAVTAACNRCTVAFTLASCDPHGSLSD